MTNQTKTPGAMVLVPRDKLSYALQADPSLGASAHILLRGWNAMKELRQILANAPYEQPPAVGGEPEPDVLSIVTPKVIVDGTVTEWWPALCNYTSDELKKVVGEYRVVHKLYSESKIAPLLAELDALRKEASKLRGER